VKTLKLKTYSNDDVIYFAVLCYMFRPKHCSIRAVQQLHVNRFIIYSEGLVALGSHGIATFYGKL